MSKPTRKPPPLDLMRRWFKPLDRQRPKLSAVTHNMRPGESIVVHVLHEATCRHWSGGPCCCDPDVVLDASLPAMEITWYV